MESVNGVACSSGVKGCQEGEYVENNLEMFDTKEAYAGRMCFINVDYFSVLFKKRYKVAPLEYRKQRFTDKH